MIAGRMIEAFSEKCVKDVTAVMAECAGVEFTVKGSVIRQAGWRAVYGEENKDETTIPGWQEGDTLTLKASSITEGKTKPSRYIPKPPCCPQWKRRARKSRMTHCGRR